jgi:hypothetical protein
MITWDTPLLGTVVLFLLFLGPCYAWGLLYFFRDNFQWHLASMVGISITVSLTGVLVWYVRGWPYEQYVYDLAVVFTAASPWMALVGWILERDRRATRRQLKFARMQAQVMAQYLDKANARIEAQQEERQIMMAEIKQLIKDNQKSDIQLLHEALALIGLRDEAKRILETRKN